MKLFLVGGTVRDKLLGLPQNDDIDFACEALSFDEMAHELEHKYKTHIYLRKPEFGTIRGKLDRTVFLRKELANPFGGFLPLTKSAWINADFTICRADGQYHDNRHPSTITPCDIYDDIMRRDFTINAIAIGEDGERIQPGFADEDLESRTLRTVGNPATRFSEDALRILRGIRFTITKDLRNTEHTTQSAMRQLAHTLTSLPHERIRDELHKMFKHNTYHSILTLTHVYPNVSNYILRKGPIWLEPTIKER